MKKLYFINEDETTIIYVVNCGEKLKVIKSDDYDSFEDFMDKFIDEIATLCGFDFSKPNCVDDFFKIFNDVCFLDPDSINPFSQMYGVIVEMIEAGSSVLDDINLIYRGLNEIRSVSNNTLTYDEKITDISRKDSIWHPGNILSFIYQGRYEVIVSAVGEVRATYHYMNGKSETWIDKNGDGTIPKQLNYLGYECDEDLEHLNDINESPYLEFGNRNWYEISVYDKVEDKPIYENCIEWNDIFDIVSYLNEIL